LEAFHQKAQNGSYCPKLIIAPPNQHRGDVHEDEESIPNNYNIPEDVDFQFAEYERIDWHNVFVTKKMGASSYFVRKGISRKAQLAIYTSKYIITKNPKSILKQAIPQTIVIETWDAFDHGCDKLQNFEYGIASATNIELEKQVTKTNSSLYSIKDKLMNICLKEATDAMQRAEEEYEHAVAQSYNHYDKRRKGRKAYLTLPPVWILKPSTVNKGEGIKILHCVEEVLDAVMEDSNIREWYVGIYVSAT
jgi:hypothetical protein